MPGQGSWAGEVDGRGAAPLTVRARNLEMMGRSCRSSRPTSLSLRPPLSCGFTAIGLFLTFFPSSSEGQPPSAAPFPSGLFARRSSLCSRALPCTLSIAHERSPSPKAVLQPRLPNEEVSSQPSGLDAMKEPLKKKKGLQLHPPVSQYVCVPRLLPRVTHE